MLCTGSDCVMQVLWDILSNTSTYSRPKSESTEEPEERGVATVLTSLREDVSRRVRVLASTIVSQREQQWRLEMESQMLHTTVEEAMQKIEEVGESLILL